MTPTDLKVLQVHNRYLTGPGGEDTTLEQEARMLCDFGHSVEQLIVTTTKADVESIQSKVRTGIKTVWSREGGRLIAAAIKAHHPDVIHVHNTFPLLSPSVYWTASHMGVPVVQTLQNYRLTCANALLQRDNQPCEDCVGRFPLAALRYKCYKDSFTSTIPMVTMQVINRLNGAYTQAVNAYIVLNEFSKELMTRAGLPAEKIQIKPNFIYDTLEGQTVALTRKPAIVYVGKLVKEKSVDFLIEAWKRLPPHSFELIIVGDGPEKEYLHQCAGNATNIVWTGWQEAKAVLEIVQRSKFLILPSRWYEGQPLVLIEALSVGTPVIVPALGALPEMTDARKAGFVFDSGIEASLSHVLNQAINLDQEEWSRMALAARDFFLSKFSQKVNHDLLMNIYQSVIKPQK